MWIKIPGVLLVIISCTGLGISAAARLTERRKLLEKLRKMVSHLKGEILYANAPLPEAFDRTGEKNPGEAGNLFQKVATELRKETGENFGEIWKRETKAFCKTSVLNKKEEEQLAGFGEHLGYLDREMQEKTILFYLEELEHSIKELKEQEPVKGKLFLSMGLISGLFLSVVMV